jgi:aspartyl-tRNA(Asn)/glutamyl-tRNA(Gln) amidotransferase subunit A
MTAAPTTPFRLLPLDDAPDLCRMGVAELAEGFRRGVISPVEAAQATLARAEAINPRLNAFVSLDPDGALNAARASEARWRRGEPLSPIDGVPTTLKDIVNIDGWTVRYGSTTTDAAARCSHDAPAVARLRAAGAVFIGLTTIPEFGWKAVTDNPLHGVARNPWDEGRTPGGSSGGSAIAAATGAGVLHLGTDGGGSIRVPASFTGIAGLKPTFGRVPAHPLSAFGTVAHLGPMGRSVDDIAAMLVAMSGRDIGDWAQGPGDLGPCAPIAESIAGARVGYWSQPPSGRLDPEVEAATEAVVRGLASAGAHVEPFDLPGADDLLGIFDTIWSTGAAVRLHGINEGRLARVDPRLRELAAFGASQSAVELALAHHRRGAFGEAMDRQLARLDFLVSPATSIPAFAAGEEFPAGSSGRWWTEWAGFSYPINLSQQPAASIPCGLTGGGLPIGLQIVGARGADGRVLGFARAVEAMLRG